MKDMPLNLTGLDAQYDVDQDLLPVCRVLATAGDVVLVGSLPPSTLRALGLHWLEVAEAAEQDARLFQAVKTVEVPDLMAGMILREVMDARLAATVEPVSLNGEGSNGHVPAEDVNASV